MLPLQLVGAGLRRDVDDDTGAERRGGIEPAGLDLNVGDRFGAQPHVGRQALTEGAHVRAVHLEHVAIDFAATQQVHLTALRIIDRAAGHTGRDLEKVGPVTTAAERQTALEVAVDVHALRCFRNFEDRSFGIDLDGLLEFADPHHDVGAEIETRAHDDAGTDVPGKPGELGREAVRPGGSSRRR